LLPLDEPVAASSIGWRELSYPLELEFKQATPEYCGVVQVMRVRDGSIATGMLTCFPVAAEDLAVVPAELASCTMAERARYVRSWCTDNRQACSAPTSPADRPVACEQYAAACGVYVGRRADDEKACGP
jgi:hypothetical protein